METLDKEFNCAIALSKLNFSEEERATMKESLKPLFCGIEKLYEVNTDGVSRAENVSGQVNSLRKDEPRPSQDREELLVSSPDHDGKYVVVQPVLE